MKKILLGSTALVAAGVIAGGAAQAEDQPIAVTVGGYYHSALAIIDQDSDDGEFADQTNSIAFGQDLEIRVGGSATFDNGLTAGFVANIEGTESGDDSDTLDERFVFFRGNFGQFRVGADESARQQFTNFAPGGSGIFGVNTPFFIFGDPGNAAGIFNVTTYDDVLGSEDSLKLVYFSPSFNGFEFALSYAPSDEGQSQYGRNARSGLNWDATNTGVGTLLDQMSAAVAYANDFGDFNVRVMGGYETYNLDKCSTTAGSQNCEDSPESWQFGGTVGFGKVSVGGGYLIRDLVVNDSAGSGREREDWDVGVAYWDAMWGVGLQYGSVNQDSLTAGQEQTFDIIALNGTYILGPGVSVQAQIDFGNFEDDAPGPNTDNEFVEFMIGSSLSF
ncbi:MAG: porin [Alphaproteobacteria bacterium]